MNACFADTFFFLALLNREDDRYHAKAIEFNRIDRPIITTSWILLELSDHLCDVRNRHLSAQVREAVKNDERFEIILASQLMLQRAYDLYDQRADKDWSLTDCTSFLVMQDRGIIDALTADRHFEQAGFKALLK